MTSLKSKPDNIKIVCAGNIMFIVICLLLRACFNELQDNYTILWIVLDYTSDAIYYTDCFVKSRTGDKSSHTQDKDAQRRIAYLNIYAHNNTTHFL